MTEKTKTALPEEFKKPVAEHWKFYEFNCMPDEAGRTQREETKQAFYAGMYAMFIAMTQMSEIDLDDFDKNEKEILEILSRHRADLVNYALSRIEMDDQKG